MVLGRTTEELLMEGLITLVDEDGSLTEELRMVLFAKGALWEG